MAFKKREAAAIVGLSKTRLSAMEQIDTDQGSTIDYGGPSDPLTKTEFKTQIDLCDTSVNEYNKFLEQADKKGNEILANEKKLADMYTRVLSSAKGKFTTDGSEIEQLGGKRKSERKKPIRKPKTS